MSKNKTESSPKTASAEDAPKLPKHIWLNVLLPGMDIETLIAFSAASKETRYFVMMELMKRPEFNERLRANLRKIENEIRTYQAEINRLRWDAWVGYNNEAKIAHGLSAFMLILALMNLHGLITQCLTYDDLSYITLLAAIGFGASTFGTIVTHDIFTNINYNPILFYSLNTKTYGQKITDNQQKQHALTHLHHWTNPSSITSHSLFAPVPQRKSEETPAEAPSCVIL